MSEFIAWDDANKKLLGDPTEVPRVVSDGEGGWQILRKSVGNTALMAAGIETHSEVDEQHHEDAKGEQR